MTGDRPAEVCQFCGDEPDQDEGYAPLWGCGTTTSPMGIIQSSQCKDQQNARLTAELQAAEGKLAAIEAEMKTARSLIARSHPFAVAYAKDIIEAAENDIDEMGETDIDDEEARDWSMEKQTASEATSLAEEMRDWLILHHTPQGACNGERDGRENLHRDGL